METRPFNLLQESGWLPGENKDCLPTYSVELAHLAPSSKTPIRRPPRPSTWTWPTTPAASLSNASTSKSAAKASKQPVLLSGGNPRIAKAYGDAAMQAYIAAMLGQNSEIGRHHQ